MKSQEELFRGLSVNPRLAGNIYRDICMFYEAYPGFESKPSTSTSGKQFLQFDGVLPLLKFNRWHLVPVTFFLPFPSYPDEHPLARLKLSGIVASTYIGYDGTFTSGWVCQWVPRKSTLSDYAAGVVALLQRYDVVSPHVLCGAIVNPEDLVQMGLKEAACLGREIKDGSERQRDLSNQIEQLRDLALIVKENLTNFKRLSEQMTETVQIPESVESGLREQAKREAYQDVRHCVLENFRSGYITCDQLVKVIRNNAKAHFENDVLPQMR